MHLNALLSEQVKVLDVIGPIDPANALDTYEGAWIDMSKYHRVMALVSCGDVVSALTAAFEQNTQANLDDSPDTAGKAISGKTVSFTSPTGDSKQKIINLHGDDLDVENSYQHVRLVVTNQDSPPGVLGFHAVVVGIPKNVTPADHVASVTEVVS